MNKKTIMIISGVVLLLIIFVISYIFIQNNKYNKRPENMENMSYYETEQYKAIIWNNRTYVPYTTVKNSDRGQWIGIVNNDEEDRVYQYKDYPTNEWIILYNNSETILMKEINLTQIPDGLTSEYEWNNKELSDLDKFYNNYLTKNYTDIRELSGSYNTQDAQKDNCFVIGAMVHNDNLYNEFMSKYRNNESAFIRVAQNTTEGDTILYDIMYDSESQGLTLVTDLTRDEFSSEEDRTIKLAKYEKIANYEHKEHLYWVLYNGELNDETFGTDSVFIITLIN